MHIHGIYIHEHIHTNTHLSSCSDERLCSLAALCEVFCIFVCVGVFMRANIYTHVLQIYT